MAQKPRAQVTRRRFLTASGLMVAGAGIPDAYSAADPPDDTQGSATPPITHILADWVAHCRPEDVPPAARKEAVRSLVNWAAVTIGGSQQAAVEIALATVAQFACTPGVSLFARTEKLDPLRGALITGISAHVLDFDDTDLETIIHPAGPIASALFSLCQQHPLSGADLLHAFIIGVDVECRLGRAIYPSHYQMGWHITGTCGAFGAAAACGKALGLDTNHLQMALGIVATEAAGLKVEFGTMCKSLNMGRAAQNGLLSALLASKGYTGAANAIEGKDGYVQAASLHHDYSAITEGLGKEYEISRNTYKPFACGIVIHPVIDAVLQLRRQYHLKPEQVRSIVVEANPLVLQLTGKQHPQDGLEGKFSVYHSAAVALVRGDAGPAEYTTAAVKDPTVVALRDRVTVHVNPAIHKDEALVTIDLKDGQVLKKHVEHAIGSAANPLSDADLDHKFRELAQGILPHEQSEKVLALAWRMESLPEAADLPRSAARKRGA